MKKKDFYIQIRNFGTEFGYNNEPYFLQNDQIRYVPYCATDGLPDGFAAASTTPGTARSTLRRAGV